MNLNRRVPLAIVLWAAVTSHSYGEVIELARGPGLTKGPDEKVRAMIMTFIDSLYACDPTYRHSSLHNNEKGVKIYYRQSGADSFHVYVIGVVDRRTVSQYVELTAEFMSKSDLNDYHLLFYEKIVSVPKGNNTFSDVKTGLYASYYEKLSTFKTPEPKTDEPKSNETRQTRGERPERMMLSNSWQGLTSVWRAAYSTGRKTWKDPSIRTDGPVRNLVSAGRTS